MIIRLLMLFSSERRAFYGYPEPLVNTINTDYFKLKTFYFTPIYIYLDTE